jgi:hypothetical protein
LPERLAEDAMRRGWLALIVGLAIAGALAVAMYARVARPLPGGGSENMSTTLAYPTLFYLNLPGIALMWLALILTQFNANWSQPLNQLLVTTGNAIFYGFAAYVVVTLAKRWGQM